MKHDQLEGSEGDGCARTQPAPILLAAASESRGDTMRSFGEPAQWMAVALSTDGLISSITSTTEQLTGYSAHELVGRPITTILADRSVFEVPQMLQSASEWGVWEGEIVHRDRSGNSLKMLASLTQLNARENISAGFLLLSALCRQPADHGADGSLWDVAAHLRKTAHELNNPLAVMMGFAQLILLDPRCEGKLRADVDRLYTEMQRLIHVVEKLHAYAISLQEGQPELSKTS